MKLDRAFIAAVLERPLFRIRRNDDAKNAAFVVTLADRTRLFLKVTRDVEAVHLEYRCLSDLHALRASFRHFAVPVPIDVVVKSGWACLVLAHVPGRTLKRAWPGSPADDFARRTIAATAEVHEALRLIDATRAVRRRGVRAWLAWVEQLARTFEREAAPVSSELSRFRDAGGCLIEGLRRVWSDALDVYKDANPANWIVSGGRLVAVDFEVSRLRPWIVDVINVAEYAPTADDLERTAALVDHYVEMRRQVTGSRPDVDAGSALPIAGVIRHTEQILHRSRDLLARAPHAEWHLDALGRHHAAMRHHARNLTERTMRDAAETLAGICDRLVRSLKGAGR